MKMDAGFSLNGKQLNLNFLTHFMSDMLCTVVIALAQNSLAI